MFNKRFKQGVLQRASTLPESIDAGVRKETSSTVAGTDDSEVSLLARNYRRMHQAIILIIAGVLAYTIVHLVYEVFLARDGSLFLKLPENASALSHD